MSLMRVYPALTVSGEFKKLGELGFSGSLNDRQYAALVDAGYSGSLADMMYSFFVAGGVYPEGEPIPGGTISPTSITVKEGTTFSQQFTASGGTGPYTWSIQSGTLPGGLTLTGDTISGTPTGTEGDAYSFTIRAADSTDDYVDQVISGAIEAAIGPIPGATLSPATLPNPLKNQAYSQAMSVVGDPGPFTWTSNISDGLSIDPSTGVISGTTTLTYGSTRTITITATRGDGDFVSEVRTYRVEVPVTPYTWTMTAAPASGIQGPGYIAGGLTGEITSEPIAGHPIQNQWVSTSSGNQVFNLEGDCTAIIASFTEFVIDGTPYTVTGSSFLSGDTFVSVTGVPQYVEGNSYSCELR